MSIELKGLTKSYGTVPVVSDLNVRFREGGISVFLGPSGCGKTTTLRCIAGLEDPNEGEIEVDGKIVFSGKRGLNLPPEKRELGMVFQSYAIWPHMTVEENVRLPLKARGMPGEQMNKRTADALTLVGLGDLGARSATKLSGGQQQRVALARCLVAQPRFILLDEPLSNLDAKLRIAMRAELRDLQKRIGATMIFVTHDQEEAMSIADEVFLFHEGRIEQRGAPTELYQRPRSRYVAEFLGKANLIPVSIEAGADGEKVVKAGQTPLLTLPAEYDAGSFKAGLCMVRPEAWKVSASDGIPGTVAQTMFMGDRIELHVQTAIGPQVAIVLGYYNYAVGDKIALSTEAGSIHLIPGA